MSLGELLLIFIVAIIVFGPTKLPMLATHLGQFMRKVNQLKEHTSSFWQQQLNEIQLHENQRKAEKADLHYQKTDPENKNSDNTENIRPS
ncbi:TPA: twin-arginine translocase TatA/TatE family subunit [Legionella pneumophila]|uniref:Twin-arginine translocase TatA/TatE family subunit n=1 Tax=Legionella pneumophila TaxID=446 RepID=A0AAN5P490_LEGPN|nr:twin-arginine translocase TatA/TatE family subunit [Legionella pneumophila]HAT1596608.1 twin-arginine translocase TatA/TatE family subunit [Legionella pneumophila]HAT1972788.1 twin-arginine translocase TatA/TatE family subunit [Legionella pneumophila]HAT3976913.1 twin-arginine translocase TatA/TatE family subunit [Legionella pneumophila]HAT6957344.1 preprotein translocase subunit TatB [Legionella pneumophila]HAT8355729.1 preprotein translocase subunit TatB [Legionella pneumophila]